MRVYDCRTFTPPYDLDGIWHHTYNINWCVNRAFEIGTWNLYYHSTEVKADDVWMRLVHPIKLASRTIPYPVFLCTNSGPTAFCGYCAESQDTPLARPEHIIVSQPYERKGVKYNVGLFYITPGATYAKGHLIMTMGWGGVIMPFSPTVVPLPKE